MSMALLIIGGLLLLGAVLLAYQLRNARRDSRSVEAHHQLLGRLQHAAEANPEHAHPPVGPRVRVVPDGSSRQAGEPWPTTPVEVPPPPPPPSVVQTTPRLVEEPGAAAAGSVPGEAQPRPALPPLAPSGLPLSMIHPVVRPRRAWPLAGFRPARRTVVATTALLVAGASTAIGLVITGGNGPGSGTHHRHLAAPPGGTTHPSLPASPSTTPPNRTATATATSTGPTSATYVVTATPIDLTVAASNRCWVELRSGSASGPLLFEGLLVAGSSHVFSNPSGVWLRLGYPPAVRVQVDGSRVHLPVSGQPYDVSVQTA